MLGTIVAVVVMISAFFYIQYQNSIHNTLEDRKSFASEMKSGGVIVSEIVMEDHIISQVVAGDRVGFMIFASNENNDYQWQSTMLSQNQVISETIIMNSEVYEVLICEKPNLNYVETIYTHNGKTIASLKTQCGGKTMVVQKAPEKKAYTRMVTWYDTLGNQYKD